MKVLITGAGGFLGRAVAARALELPGLSRLVLADRSFNDPPVAGCDYAAGDLMEHAFVEGLTEPGFDLILHLASLPGALAECEPAQGYAINLHSSLTLARLAAARRSGAQFVFASSIAVYGQLGGATVRDETATNPILSYGAHKLMTEIFLSDLTRRGELRAISLRLPGLVARSTTESGHGSAFMSHIFRKIAAGEAYACPVSATASCWWLSRAAAAEAVIHGATLSPLRPTVLQLPALRATMAEVAAAIERVTGRRANVTWGDDTQLTRLFGAMPELDATTALRLGFHADDNLDDLVRNSLEMAAVRC